MPSKKQKPPVTSPWHPAKSASFQCLARLYTALSIPNDGLITFPGGLPILDEEGMLIGAIGVSGDTVENDHLVAQAGVNVAGVCDVLKHLWRT